MNKVNLKNIVWKEGDCYVSWNINTSISSFGDTKKEALESLREALELYFEDTPISQVSEVEQLDIVPSIFEYA
ncbi:MAG: type II toxin-antitoxin system HicB family antitoxin [bacterium]